MAITKRQILERVEKGDICFTPPIDTFQLQAHAVDLRLGFTYLLPKGWHMTTKGREALTIDHFEKKRPQYFDVIELEQGQYFDLLPHEHILVSTLEKIKVPDDLMAVLYPRSSTNRKGLSVDLTGIIDSGYEGQLTIPIRNNTEHQVVRLHPGERFCQVVFEPLTEKIEARKSRYHKKDIIEGSIVDDKDQLEIDLILKGDIKKLKEEYKISK
jgi:dCTP deaminase